MEGVEPSSELVLESGWLQALPRLTARGVD